MRRPTTVPGGLSVTLLWVFASSSGFPHGVNRHLYFVVTVEESTYWSHQENCSFPFVGSDAQGNIGIVNKIHVKRVIC
jgi:hypothetical protein